MRKRFQDVGGFSLVEIVIAVGIVGFCLIPLLALLPAGLKAVKNSSHETTAVNIISSVAADMGNATFTNNSSIYDIPVLPPPADQTSNVRYFDWTGAPLASAAEAGFKLVLTFNSADASLGRFRSWQSRITWPASAPDPEGTVETLLVLPDKVY